jgi:hypothetical protein
MPRLESWKNVLILAVVSITSGCGSPRTLELESTQLKRTWRLERQRSDEQFKGVSLVAELTPDPLRPDKPAMLELRVAAENAERPFQGRIWYRFATRRGDRQPHDRSLILPPASAQEEGVEPHYNDWFEWAEIVEPRNEGGQLIFDAPVMFTEGKAFVQFRVTGDPNLPPLELLDWFVYALNAE